MKMQHDSQAVFAKVVERAVYPIVFLIFALANVSVVDAENWPQWRGGDRTSKSSEASVPIEWNKEKNMLWRVPMPGPAVASPVVWGDDAFATSIDGESLVLI